MKVLNLVWVVLLLFPPVTAAAEAGLPSELAAAIKDTDFTTDGIGLFIQGVDDDKPLVAFHADRFLNPASVIKLVTTAAALDLLGQGYRWSTEVMYTGTIEGHTLNGDLYFRGNGDPYLTPERFWRLLNRVFISGIHRITGDVVIDNSYFEPGKVDYAAFDEQPYRTYNVGPNAVLVGFQATEFHFYIDTTETGQAVRITPFPQSPRLRIINQVKLVNGRCSAWQKRLSLETRNNAGMLEVVFTGNYARSCNQRTLYRRVSEAQDHYQHFFLPLWSQLGGSLDGKITQGIVPADARRVVEEPSISLAEAVRLVNKFSNNVMTRQILLSLGAKQSGPPGTAEKGLAAVNAWLVEQDLDHPDLQLDNGAGLSRDARISAGLLGELLLHVYAQAYMAEFIAALPVSGYDGTMAHRFDDSPLVGHAHIKTGLLDFVQSMAGYVTSANGKRYVVVLLHNDPRAHTRSAEELQNQVINWIYQLK
ncbi:MAG: D-alanyl-D-alanine carboxypeptidase/D-alanyl-D-alanine-endopeptidase [Thiotrichales bacterium]|nr:MAG: D-alanyl-D-alanine carboxypeptidase/D-alanyl-D-alanine-endopeptidase [Thiotrichales bacterium]